MEAVSEPLYFTTSFQKKSSLHPNRGDYSYSRTANPNFTTLEQHLVNLYPGSDKAILFPSGLNAISVLFEYYAENNSVFIVGNEMYCDTYRTLNYLKKKYHNFIYHAVDVQDTDKIMALTIEYGKRIKLFFFESASNPNGFILDFCKIKEIKTKLPTAKFVIDNSWMSGVLFNPLDHGVDLVMESLSKYIGGGRVIMGAIVGKKNRIRKIEKYCQTFGIRVSQYDSWTVSDMILTLKHRMHYLAAITPDIAEFLYHHPKITKIFYPLLNNHPSHERCLKYFKGGPGIISFQIPIGKDDAVKFSDQSNIILYATSYGKPETMICPYQHTDEHGTWIRLSIGWASDKDVIIKELDRLLNQI